MKDKTNLDRLLTAIEQFSQASVMVIGDVMIDHFVYGSSDRISPEAPIPVLSQQNIKSMLGGAGNVAMNLLAYGAQVNLIGLVGDDDQGRRLLDICKTHQNLSAHLVKDPTRVTSVKTRFVAQSQQLLRLDEETSHIICDEIADEILKIAAHQINNASVLILSDYAKGLLSPALCRQLIAMAKKAGKPVLVDPKSADFSVYGGASLVSPNLKEMEKVTGLLASDDDSAEALCRSVLEKFDVAAVLLTRGAAGMSLVEQSADQAFHIGSQAKSVYDVSGAGDTVISTIAAGLAVDLGLADAVELANHAAGIVVAKTGTGTVSRRELRHALGQVSLRQPSSLQDALERIQIWKDSCKTIGFTNGCFDLLHLGHLHSLEEAKKHCDILIVGVNSDASVKQLKGPGRPIQDQMTRARILSCLEFCDAVIIFGEETPRQLIEQLVPDILFKGADYESKPIAGSDVVETNGGRVVLIPLLPGNSTTQTIARLNNTQPADA